MIGEKFSSYTILEIVGNGSLGTVYRAEDPDGRLVALKLVRSRVLNTAERRERFLQSALAASEIRDPRICPILEIGDDQDDFFIITPFISGKSLDRYMENKPLPLSYALDIAIAAGSAIEAIHVAGMAHAGLKPANIWILDSHDPRVMLSDCCIGALAEAGNFGKSANSNSGIRDRDMSYSFGSLAYVAPEQILGEIPDQRTDVFAFGLILYEMLSGRHPFQLSNLRICPRAILEADRSSIFADKSAVPLDLEPVLRKALATHREERYPSMHAMLADLKLFRESAFFQPVPATAPPGIRNWIISKFRRCLRK